MIVLTFAVLTSSSAGSVTPAHDQHNYKYSSKYAHIKAEAVCSSSPEVVHLPNNITDHFLCFLKPAL